MIMMENVAASIVLYENSLQQVRKCIESVKSENFLVKCIVIDNSPTDKLNELVAGNARTEYIHNPSNSGFGAAHNIAMQASIKNGNKYHLVLNPDVYFEKGVLETLYDFMESNPDIGLIMPKILYPDGSIQYLCKLLPTPMDLIRRRFFPASKYLAEKNFLYELRFTGYNKIMDVPYLSGCFMFIRTEALIRVGLFDERFFMYMEDVDLSRRIHKHYRTVYYPEVSVFHEYEKGSYKNSKLLRYHLLSAARYFNKWGYFNDSERKSINSKCLKGLCNGE